MVITLFVVYFFILKNSNTPGLKNIQEALGRPKTTNVVAHICLKVVTVLLDFAIQTKTNSKEK